MIDYESSVMELTLINIR